MGTVKRIKDYSVFIVDLKKKVIELEKNCLHGVVKDDAATYTAIRNSIADLIGDLTGIYEWANEERSKAYAKNSERSAKYERSN